MKRAIATLLSLSMMFSIMAQSPAVYAEELFVSESAEQEELAAPDVGTAQEYTVATPETGNDQNESKEKQIEEGSQPAETIDTLTGETALLDEEAIQPAVVQDTAGVEVCVQAGLPLERAVNLQVVLKQNVSGAVPQEKTLTLPVSDSESGVPAQAEVRFSNLPAGEYTLTVSGDGFAAYTQTITVDNLLYAVQLSTGALATDTYSSAHPGVLRIGDVNGNGSLEQSDANLLIDEMEEGTAENGDLDGNRTVNLVDLQMLADSLSDTTAVLSTITEKIPETLTQPAVEEGTVLATGTVEDLLTGENKVGLKSSTEKAISEENPVSVSFDFGQEEDTAIQMGGLVLQTPVNSDGAVVGGEVLVYGENGSLETTIAISEGGARMARSAGGAYVQSDGSIVVDFGGQIAVKKVTIKVTAVSNKGNLAEITKVDFLNDMESHIPPPQMDIPQNLKAEPGNQSFTLQWDPAVNVTGYEVLISQGDQSETVRTASTSLSVTTFGGKKLQNNTHYAVQVQSVNGEWRSGYSAAVDVTPKADKLPPAPDALTLNGRFQRIEASWANMKDTDTYNVYYRKDGDSDFIKVEGVATNSYTIQGLENNTRYEVYVTGVNELGEGPASLVSSISTANVSPVKMPTYNLINTPGAAGEVTANIQSVTRKGGYMKDSPLDSESTTAWGVVDNDYASWYGVNDWDDGATYPDEGGVRVTFDQAYHIGSISLAQSEDIGYYGRVVVYAHGEDGNEYTVPGVSITKHSDGSRSYYTIKIAGGVTTDYLRVCVGHTYNVRPVSIAEMRFYTYDSLEDDIFALYADDLHLTLNEGVEESTIEALQTRLDTPDEVSGEYHPDRDKLQRELDNARGLLNASLQDVVQVHTGITAQKDGHLGFTGLNAWQPLGVTAQAGEELVIYVGSNNGTTGSNAALQLVVTQYNAEYGQLSKSIALKIGRNEIMVPELVTFDAEHGGPLYVQYTGNNSADQYSVRVSGGLQIPVLDLYGIDDAGERETRVTAYVEELESYTAGLEAQHGTLHADTAYNAEKCILNTTDVLLDQMMYSVPASQLLAGLGAGETSEKAARLLNSVDAMDQMMILFYQHKGLTNLEDAGNTNRLPAQHLNIRYMRMFAGAFMYAAGNHIGIGWGSVPGLAEGNPIVLNEDGSYQSGNYFGWGIAHEIGHNINQGKYAVAEVTNNYFAQISQTSDGMRFGYDAIYSKVTSGTTGAAGDVFTQLGMYWQLHLAYDKGYEYQIYDNYNDLLESRFYARVDTYARNTASAPAPEGVKLSLGGDANQNFMRLASAAAQKDLTDFFVRWGLIPDTTTAAYMAQFEAETRALYYVNDDARTYGFTHSADATIAGKDVLTEGTTAVVDEKTANQVNLTLASTVDSDLLLGYEITRVTYENGEANAQVVGFTTGDSYTDTVTTINNRAVAYQITAIDKFLNRSQTLTLPAVKISHDGSYDKSQWTVTTNMTSEQDTTPDATEQDPCDPDPVSAITQVIDNKKETTYTGQAKGEATVTLNFHKTLAVTGFKYTVTSGTAIQNYEIQISTDGSSWQTLATGTFAGDTVNTVYFPNTEGKPWLCTYDATQLRLIVKAPTGSAVSISELDVLGPTGDNVELLENGIGTLESDYKYADGEGDVIPQGSLVFTGSYKGNPAYNVVLLYDQNGEIVGGLDAEGNTVAHQIILAPDPKNGLLGDVSEGYWVYWIEPDALEGMTMPETVRAELYRVDEATTNVGQRLTSDTLPVELPEPLPSITIGSAD